MRLAFTLVIKGDKRLEEKLRYAIENNHRLHTELIENFLAAIVRKLNIKTEDDISIENFKAGILPEENS
jgi:hypothetical protein